MENAGLKRKLGWLEWCLYAGGALLLVVFFQVRSEGERQRLEGIEAFQAMSEQAAVVQPEDASAGSPEAVAARAPGEVWTPDQAQWSEARIRDFEASRGKGGELPLAVMAIDKLGIHVPVYNGTDEHLLSRGVGRIKGTAWIDQAGNLGIAGHRDSFFRPLKDIEIGDTIDVRTTRGTVTYEVSSITITDPSDVSVLAPTDERTITLVTCYPFYYVGHAPKRYIVKATAEHFLAKT